MTNEQQQLGILGPVQNLFEGRKAFSRRPVLGPQAGAQQSKESISPHRFPFC
jgi:hypothetical protein